MQSKLVRLQCFQSFYFYKSKLELKSNSNEILPVNCKFTVILFQLNLTKFKLEVLKAAITHNESIENALVYFIV